MPVAVPVLGLFLGAAAPPLPPDAGQTVVTPFATDVQPRVDPVFGGVAALRTAIDEFLALEEDMKKTRDAFSNAVHEAQRQLRPTMGAAGAPGPRDCPPGAITAEAKARDAGRRFLALGRRFEARYREIRRGLGVGDTVALTPDYRWKAGRARDLYTELLRDYQEMRAAFHDQLGAELRHAGCKVEVLANGKGARPIPSLGDTTPDPNNPDDWSLATADEPLPTVVVPPPQPRARRANPKPADTDSSPAIWIQIDNTRCARPSSFTLDGRPVAAIPAGKKVQIRTRAGPHQLCVLPATEKRACGATGTVRDVYLYEGWSMAVRCAK
jgi:hypothetical protein